MIICSTNLPPLSAPDVVLTAAHCYYPNDEFVVRINPHSLDDPLNKEQVFGEVRSIRHPYYTFEASIDNDVMIIVLNGTSRFTPVRVNGDANVPKPNDALSVMGWGDLNDGATDYPSILQVEQDTYYVENDECERMTVGGELGEYTGLVSNDMMCVVEAEGGACQGDSGGPLILEGGDDEPEDDVLVGIVSWGFGCALAQYPGTRRTKRHVVVWSCVYYSHVCLLRAYARG